MTRDPLELGNIRPTARNEDQTERTTPISPEANNALHEAVIRINTPHRDALNEALAPYGLHINDIAVPTYHRVIYTDEL